MEVVGVVSLRRKSKLFVVQRLTKTQRTIQHGEADASNQKSTGTPLACPGYEARRKNCRVRGVRNLACRLLLALQLLCSLRFYYALFGGHRVYVSLGDGIPLIQEFAQLTYQLGFLRGQIFLLGRVGF